MFCFIERKRFETKNVLKSALLLYWYKTKDMKGIKSDKKGDESDKMNIKGGKSDKKEAKSFNRII